MPRTPYVFVSERSFIADPDSITRDGGHQIDWDSVPESYRLNATTVTLAGAVVGARNTVVKKVFANATGGTFIDTYATVPTGAITYSATAATLVANMQAAYDALSTIGAGNSIVSAGPGGVAEIYIEFTGKLGAQPITAPTSNAGSLTSGSTATITTSTPITGVSSATSITVTPTIQDIPDNSWIHFPGGVNAQTTAAVPAGATTIPVTHIVGNIPTASVGNIYGSLAKIILAGTAMGIAGTSDGMKMAPRVASTNPAIGLLETDAQEFPGRSDALTGFGLIRGGIIYENMTPDGSANSGTIPSGIKTELAAAGTGWVYLSHTNTATTQS